MSFVLTQNGALSPINSLITGGTYTFSAPPSAFVSISGLPVYAGPLKYTFSGGSSPGFIDGSIVSTGEQTINPTPSSMTVEGKPVVRVGDQGVMSAVGELTAGGTGPISGPVEVSDAGQESVEAI